MCTVRLSLSGALGIEFLTKYSTHNELNVAMSGLTYLPV